MCRGSCRGFVGAREPWFDVLRCLLLSEAATEEKVENEGGVSHFQKGAHIHDPSMNSHPLFPFGKPQTTSCAPSAPRGARFLLHRRGMLRPLQTRSKSQSPKTQPNHQPPSLPSEKHTCSVSPSRAPGALPPSLVPDRNVTCAYPSCHDHSDPTRRTLYYASSSFCALILSRSRSRSQTQTQTRHHDRRRRRPSRGLSSPSRRTFCRHRRLHLVGVVFDCRNPSSGNTGTCQHTTLTHVSRPPFRARHLRCKSRSPPSERKMRSVGRGREILMVAAQEPTPCETKKWKH